MGLQLRPAVEADAAAIAALAAKAFHPDTDTISRRLFPAHLQPTEAQPGDTLRLWRQARKTIKLTDSRINMMVAVDEDLGGEIVGFSLWEVPARGASDDEVLPSTVYSPGLDQKAFDEMQKILAGDIHKNFGDQGTNDMWRAYSLSYLVCRFTFPFTSSYD